MTASSAGEIVQDIKAGRTTAEAVVKRALEGIEHANARLNAFTAVLAEDAVGDARQLDAQIAQGRSVGALAGVPFAVKNLFDVRGLTTLAGSKIRRSAPAADRDAELVSTLKAAGAILVGALNMDEFAYGFVTENAHYGATRNPHDLDRICGGSSGGSAAAVAAGLVPLALGSDTNGSVRVPAGLCGVYGLKPTVGRLSLEGVFPFVEGLDHAGLFARSVPDLALAYDVLRGGEAGGGASGAIAPDLDALAQTPLRAGVLNGWFTRGAASEVLDGLRRVGQALDAEFSVELPGAEAARSAAFGLSAYEGARLHASDLRTRTLDFDPAVRDRLLAGALTPKKVSDDALRFRTLFRCMAAQMFERFDVLIAPATACVAPALGQSTMTIDGETVSVRKNLGAYTQPISFIGLPVIAAPVNRPGLLPIGVQIIAAEGREDLAFAAAARLEVQGVLSAHPPKEFI